MKAIELALPDVYLLESKIFADERGFFYESFNLEAFCNAVGSQVSFVQGEAFADAEVFQ